MEIQASSFSSKEATLKLLNRRGAIKLIGIASLLPLHAKELSNEKSVHNPHAVIVGGGSGGMMALAKLQRAIPHAKITLVAPNETHIYQPGQVFVATGLYKDEEIKKNTQDYINEDVTWIQDEVQSFEPDESFVVTKNGTQINYDYLIVATGLEYDFEAIEGLNADMIGKDNITSVYLNDLKKGTAEGGVFTYQWMQKLYAEALKANEEKPLTVIFTQPDTHAKCGGAAQQMMYLCDDYLCGNSYDNQKNIHTHTKMLFCKKSEKLFGTPNYNKTLLEDVAPQYKNITNKFNHVLRKIDAKNKIATFEEIKKEKIITDEEFDEFEIVETKIFTELSYDYIHIVPPMKPTPAVANSKLASAKGLYEGYLECNRETLQHKKYKNVFGIGDILATPLGKTAGSCLHQAPIIVQNILDDLNKQNLSAKYDGYSVCPIKTQYGKLLLAEYDYEGERSTLNYIDNTKPQWLFWEIDFRLIKPIYWSVILKGYI